MSVTQAKAKSNSKRSGTRSGVSDCCGPASTASVKHSAAPVYGARLGAFYSAGPALSLDTPVQTKLVLGRTGDPFEREADAVAARVTSNRMVPPISAIPLGGLGHIAQRQEETAAEPPEEEEPVQEMAVQRQEEEEEEPVQETAIQRQAEEEEEPVQEMAIQRQEEEEEEEPVQEMAVQRQEEEEEEEPVQETAIQRQAEEEEEEPVQEAAIQRQAEEEEEEPVQARPMRGAGNDSKRPPHAVAAQAIRTREPGDSLKPTVRHTLEASMGVNLAGVRVHQGGTAHEAARALNARAFTHGSHIWLGRGASPGDTRLMAHEAAHVVQQRAVPRLSPVSSSPQHVTGAGPAFVQRDLLSGVTGTLGAAWEATGGKVVGAAGKALEMGADVFWGLLEQYAPGFVPILREISGKGIVGFLYGKIKGAVAGVLRGLNVDPAVLDSLEKTLQGLLAEAGDILTALESGDCEPLFAAIKKLKKIVTTLSGKAWDALVGFFKPIAAHYTEMWQSFGAPLVDWLKGTAGEIWELITNLGAKIWGWTKPMREAVGVVAGQLWGWIKEKLGLSDDEDSEGGLIDWVKEKAEQAWATIKKQLQIMVAPIKAVAAHVKAILPLDAILDLRRTVQGWLDRVGAMAQKMGKPNGIVAEQISLRQEILPAVLKSIQSLRDGLVNAGQWVSARIGSLAVAVTGFMDSLSDHPLLGVAKGAIQWLQDRVNNLSAWAQGGVQQLFTFIGDGLVYLSQFVEPVLDTLQQVAEVMGDIAGKLPDLVLGPLWQMIPLCIRNPIKEFVINLILKNIPVFGDLIEQLPDIWKKVRNTALVILKQVFVDGDLAGAAWTFFRTLLEVFNVPPELLSEILGKAAQVFGDILSDPLGFLINLLKAVRQGFVQFFDHIGQHLLSGVTGWLFRQLRSAGITPPADFSLKSILGFVMQVLDITAERIFKRLEKKIGKEKVAKIRKVINVLTGVWEWVSLLINEGPGALWEKLQDQLSGLWDSVLDAVIGWLTKNIIEGVIGKLLTMLDPTGIMAAINSVIAIYRAIQSFMEYVREMLEIVNTVLDGIGGIVKGNIAQAASFLESALSRAMPVAIGFLANQVGLRNLGKRIHEIVKGVRKRVDKAIDWLIDKALQGGKAILKLIKKGAKKVGDLLFPRLPFKAEGKTHTLTVEKKGAKAQLVVESSPGRPVAEYLYKLKPKIDGISNKAGWKKADKAYGEALDLRKEAADSLDDVFVPKKSKIANEQVHSKTAKLLDRIKLIWTLIGVTGLIEGEPEVGSYGDMKGEYPGTHAHHVPQNAIMKRLRVWVAAFLKRAPNAAERKNRERVVENYGALAIKEYTDNKGICMVMDARRHTKTRTYGGLDENLDIDEFETYSTSLVEGRPVDESRIGRYVTIVREELAADLEDVRSIYAGRKGFPKVKDADMRKVNRRLEKLKEKNVGKWGNFLQ